MPAAFQVDNLRCWLGGGEVEALRGVNLAVKAGEVVFVVGQSGSGKSTLVRCLCGLIPRVFPGRISGSITLNGAPLDTLPPCEIPRRVGVVFQDPASQLLGETVEDEAAFGPENLGLPQAEIMDRIDWALDVLGLGGLRHRRDQTLSLGEKQKAALASVLALRPPLLVLDEPVSSLDETSALTLLDHLSLLAREQGTGVVVLEHRTRYAPRHATRLVVLRQGTIAYDGPPDAIHEKRFCASLGLRSPHGPTTKTGVPAQADPLTSKVAVAEDISFAYPGGPAVLSGVNVEILPGKGTIVSGPNGSGKTTLLKILAGLLSQTHGHVWLDGHLRSGRRPGPAGGIAFVGQEPVYTFRQNEVEEEYLSWDSGRANGQPPEDCLLDRLHLGHLRHRHPLSLSEGEKRRLSVAAALAARPRMLVLDEPSVAYDGYHLDQLWRVLDEYMNNGGALLVASNDPDVLGKDWSARLDLAPSRAS